MRHAGGDLLDGLVTVTRVWAHLLFSLTAASSAAFAFCELRQMRAGTTGELLAALMWLQLPLLFWIVLLVWFVRIYLGAGPAATPT